MTQLIWLTEQDRKCSFWVIGSNFYASGDCIKSRGESFTTCSRGASPTDMNSSKLDIIYLSRWEVESHSLERQETNIRSWTFHPVITVIKEGKIVQMWK